MGGKAIQARKQTSVFQLHSSIFGNIRATDLNGDNRFDAKFDKVEFVLDNGRVVPMLTRLWDNTTLETIKSEAENRFISETVALSAVLAVIAVGAAVAIGWFVSPKTLTAPTTSGINEGLFVPTSSLSSHIHGRTFL